MTGPALRACSFCQGQPGVWNQWCDGCAGWVLVAEVGGHLFIGPFDAEKGDIAPWRGKPSDEAVAVETRAMMAALAPYAIAAGLADALGLG